MTYLVSELPSLKAFLADDVTEIDGDYALFIFESQWSEIENLEESEKIVFDEIVENNGHGIFNPHDS